MVAIFGSQHCDWKKLLIVCFTITLCGGGYYAYIGIEIRPIQLRFTETALNQLHLVAKNRLHNKSFRGQEVKNYTWPPMEQKHHSFNKPFRLQGVNRHHVWPSKDVRKSQGYIIAYNLYEQQTAAARNLWQLQLWAKEVGMKVVEPFVSNSTLNFTPLSDGTSNPIRFNDLYDRDHWNNKTTARNGAELVTWEEFMLKASKKIIFIYLCGNKAICPDNQSTTVQAQNNPYDAKMTRTPISSSKKFSEKALTYFKDHGFKFVRWASIKFNTSTCMPLQEFAQHVFDKYNPGDVTVIFTNWLGIRNTRINIDIGLDLTKDNTIGVGLLPSKRMVEDSEKYVQQMTHGRKYFGIMVRAERLYKTLTNMLGHNKSDAVNFIRDCAVKLSRLKELQDHEDWERTLAIDLGGFGSYGYRRFPDKYKYEKVLYNDFFKAVFGNSWTIKEFENSFTKYLGTNNAPYIAQIQRTIAAKSNCIVLVGGGSTFQTAAISFYKNFHPDVDKQCIIKHCYKGESLNLDFQDFIKNTS